MSEAENVPEIETDGRLESEISQEVESGTKGNESPAITNETEEVTKEAAVDTTEKGTEVSEKSDLPPMTVTQWLSRRDNVSGTPKRKGGPKKPVNGLRGEQKIKKTDLEAKKLAISYSSAQGLRRSQILPK